MKQVQACFTAFEKGKLRETGGRKATGTKSLLPHKMRTRHVCQAAEANASTPARSLFDGLQEIGQMGYVVGYDSLAIAFWGVAV